MRFQMSLKEKFLIKLLRVDIFFEVLYLGFPLIFGKIWYLTEESGKGELNWKEK